MIVDVMLLMTMTCGDSLPHGNVVNAITMHDISLKLEDIEKAAMTKRQLKKQLKKDAADAELLKLAKIWHESNENIDVYKIKLDLIATNQTFKYVTTSHFFNPFIVYGHRQAIKKSSNRLYKFIAAWQYAIIIAFIGAMSCLFGTTGKIIVALVQGLVILFQIYMLKAEIAAHRALSIYELQELMKMDN